MRVCAYIHVQVCPCAHTVGKLYNGPRDPDLLVFTYLCNQSSPLVWGLDLWTHFQWIEYGRRMRYHLSVGYRITMASVLDTFSLVFWSTLSSTSYHVVSWPIGAHMARRWCLWPTAREDLKLANSHVSQHV